MWWTVFGPLGCICLSLLSCLWGCSFCFGKFEGYIFRHHRPKLGRKKIHATYKIESFIISIRTEGILCWPFIFTQKLQCEYLEYTPTTKKLLVYFHGGGSNYCNELEFLHTLCGKLKCNIMYVVYPGYGNNGGVAQQKNILKEVVVD